MVGLALFQTGDNNLTKTKDYMGTLDSMEISKFMLFGGIGISILGGITM